MAPCGLKSAPLDMKNVELWQKLQQEIEKHDIIWNWVKGHSDNEGNNIADRLAVEAREKARRKQ